MYLGSELTLQTMLVVIRVLTVSTQSVYGISWVMKQLILGTLKSTYKTNFLNCSVQNKVIFFLSLYFSLHFDTALKIHFFSKESLLILTFMTHLRRVNVHHQHQGTKNTIGSTLFCFPKSKQIIC